jgi:ribosomal protection tetracycline resistance protein
MIRVSLEIPAGATGSVLAAVGRLGGTAGTSALQADLAVLETLLPAVRAQELQRQLPGLTSGEGVAETSFGGYRPLAAPAEQAQSRGGR